jgi:hypothetical protein
MSAIVRIVIDKHDTRTVRLPEIPTRGERIELADGARLIVRDSELSSKGIVAATVRASLVQPPHPHRFRSLLPN